MLDARPEPVNRLIADTIEMLRPLADGSSIRIESHVMPDLPMVTADATLISLGGSGRRTLQTGAE